jgi:hypothetical protein
MMKWKGCGSSHCLLSQHVSGGTKENHGNISHYSQAPGRSLNTRPSEYEARVLTTRPRRSVLKRRDHLWHLGDDRRIILKWILKKQCAPYSHMAQDRDRLRALAKTVQSISAHKKGRGI